MAHRRITESLNGDDAQRIDSVVQQARKHYDIAVRAAHAAARDLESFEADAAAETIDPAERRKQADDLALALRTASAEETAAREALLQALDTKQRSLQALRSRFAEQPDGEDAAAVRTDLALLDAALGDVEAKIKELENQKQGGTRRDPAPKRPRRRTTADTKLTEEIATILAEADKVKTNQETTTPTTMRYRLKARYTETVVPELIKKFEYKNVNEVPKLVKILLNMGLGDVKDDAKKFNAAVDELKVISGQKPVVTTAKKSVANFKVRQGMSIGAKVTLRGNRMYEFLDKLISVALPRVRDFKGLNPNSFDGRGNYAMGVKEQLIFPEIKYDKIDKVRGFDIAIVTTAKTDEEAKELLKLLGMPFRA